MLIPTDIYKSIPSGSTSKAVNKSVIKYLYETYGDRKDISILDIPCGGGAFIKTVKQIFPSWKVVGADLFLNETDSQGYKLADSSSKCNSQCWFGVTHLHPE